MASEMVLSMVSGGQESRFSVTISKRDACIATAINRQHWTTETTQPKKAGNRDGLRWSLCGPTPSSLYLAPESLTSHSLTLMALFAGWVVPITCAS